VSDIFKWTQPKIKEYVLDRFVFVNDGYFLKNDIIRNMDIVVRNQIDEMLLKIIVYLFGIKQEKKITFKTPLTWKDMIKEKHENKKWMRCVIKKFPIKYKKHEYNVRKIVVFPELDIPETMKHKPNIIIYETKK